MTQTFTSLILDIKENIDQSVTPSELLTALYDAVKAAENYEDEWINALYEHSDENFNDFIY